MSEIDAVILIDANKYLDLYRTDKGRGSKPARVLVVKCSV